MAGSLALDECARGVGDHGFSEAAHVEHLLFQLRQIVLKMLHYLLH